jgi:hypothetical protein
VTDPESAITSSLGCGTTTITSDTQGTTITCTATSQKVLTPNDLNSLSALEDRLLAFPDHYQSGAKPFQWRFTRQDLASLLERLAARPKAA